MNGFLIPVLAACGSRKYFFYAPLQYVYIVLKCFLIMCLYKTFSDINHSRILYDPPPRILEIKAKINKWDLMKLKSFCTTKETISKVKRQLLEWEKIIANETTKD